MGLHRIVGLEYLSRGLIPPPVLSLVGIQRTDAGMLGSGIYFSDSSNFLLEVL